VSPCGQRLQQLCGKPVSRQGVRQRETYSPLIGTTLSAFMASGFFGNEILSTPLLKLASIFSASTPLGRLKTRSKEP
jgi:hypothetical protein